MTDMKIYSGSSNPVLTKRITDDLSELIGGGQEVEGKIDLNCFPDGEISVQIQDNVRGKDLFIVQSMNDPVNNNFMELLIMIDAAKRASADRVTAVIPYFGYARQDRKDKPRVPITAKLVSNMLMSAGVDRILTVDLHSHQIQGFFDIPLDHLYARPVLYDFFLDIKFKNPNVDIVMVAPDTGAAKEIYKYADAIGCGFAIVGKERHTGNNVTSKVLVGDVKDKIAIMVDDMTSTCGTLVIASEIVKEHGAYEVYASVTHNLINEKGLEKLKSSQIKKLITTDTVFTNLNDDVVSVLSISNLLAKAIHSIHYNSSVSLLFESI